MNLIEDISSRQTALIALLSRLAKEAIHLATHLRRDTERGSVAIRNINGFNLFAIGCREEVFHGTINRTLTSRGWPTAHLVTCRQLLPVRDGDICHLVNGCHMSYIKPTRHLATGKSGTENSSGDS